MSQKIVIIGAGMAGLACARRLASAGLTPVILDKGRGIGGRMATRRVVVAGQEIRFDHGAQYIKAQDQGFVSALETVPEAVAQWQITPDKQRVVGVPGMSGLARALGAGLDIRQNVEVSRIAHGATGWQLETGAGPMTARHLVLTIPAPQAHALMAASGGCDDDLARDLARPRMEPCLTLMAAFAPDMPRPLVTRRSAADDLAWIAQDSAKPGRTGGAVTWVAQASPEWSMRYLVLDQDRIAALMLPLLAGVLGCAPEAALYASAHRWRYARTATPLGQPFLHRAAQAVHLGGDWCLGARVQDAWASGDAIARDILEARHVA
ncbi:MAG: NAD(P)/FAD-dependent oxidoreductase [Rhodobacterales bacterium]